jgi:hypothetical protein
MPKKTILPFLRQIKQILLYDVGNFIINLFNFISKKIFYKKQNYIFKGIIIFICHFLLRYPLLNAIAYINSYY